MGSIGWIETRTNSCPLLLRYFVSSNTESENSEVQGIKLLMKSVLHKRQVQCVRRVTSDSQSRIEPAFQPL